MPSDLKQGDCIVKLSLDTKSPLGVLSSQRKFNVEDPIYEKMAAQYSEALRSKDVSKAEQARKVVLAKWFMNKIAPGEGRAVSIIRIGNPPKPIQVSSNVKWYPRADYLQVDADVTDAYFSTNAPAGMPWMASAFEVFICPSGMVEDVNQFIIIPKGENGKAAVWSLLPEKALKVTATWNRTAKGYSISARIPWSLIKSYKEGWEIMPVEAQVDSKAPGGLLQLLMNKLGMPVQEARTYAGLKRE